MIYVICGPTGVGKTKLSVMLAKKLDAVVMNADSMQIYKELNIGTAKITKEEMENVPHYLFDIVSVCDDFNVFKYQQLGRELLSRFKDRDIVIVGGTGLYIKALLYDYNFDDNCNKNKKLYDFRMIGLTRDRDKLYDIINERVDQMVDQGLLQEVESLYKYENTRVMKSAIGYKEFFSYFENSVSFEETIEKIKQNSRHYAKRQYTFFYNQFDNIEWYNVDDLSLESVVEQIFV